MKDANVDETVVEEAIIQDATAEEVTFETITETDAVSVPAGREDRLDKLAKNHIMAAMGVGLIPVPCVDVAALMGIQLDLIKKLSNEYEVPFRHDLGKSIISSLAGGLFSIEVGLALSSMIKFIPVIGQTTGAVVMPVISGASTYAIHKVFVQHFESGGTFLDLDPAKVKAYFAEQFKKGKKIVTDLKREPVKSAA